ncbi:hypothetical protein L1887_42076 [Cichorium endivia]|nr:hypothetical protein L1887_42076 [Cichorium endivia]
MLMPPGEEGWGDVEAEGVVDGLVEMRVGLHDVRRCGGRGVGVRVGVCVDGKVVQGRVGSWVYRVSRGHGECDARQSTEGFRPRTSKRAAALESWEAKVQRQNPTSVSRLNSSRKKKRAAAQKKLHSDAARTDAASQKIQPIRNFSNALDPVLTRTVFPSHALTCGIIWHADSSRGLGMGTERQCRCACGIAEAVTAMHSKLLRTRGWAE